MSSFITEQDRERSRRWGAVAPRVARRSESGINIEPVAWQACYCPFTAIRAAEVVVFGTDPLEAHVTLYSTLEGISIEVTVGRRSRNGGPRFLAEGLVAWLYSSGMTFSGQKNYTSRTGTSYLVLSFTQGTSAILSKLGIVGGAE